MIITNENIFKKIGYVKFGYNSAYDDYKNDFKKDIANFCRSKGAGLVVSQTVYSWFDKNNPTISTEKSLLFLKEYFIQIDYKSLHRDQKKVHSQVQFFFKSVGVLKSQNSTNQKISVNKSNILGFKLDTSFHELDLLATKLCGNYLTYRYRFGGSINKSVAVEYLNISYSRPELRYRHWFVRADQITFFEGVIAKIGPLLWFIGNSNHKNDNRLRIMHIRDEGVTSKTYDKVRWGIISSNNPDPQRNDPVACRVVLVKQNVELTNAEQRKKFAQEHTSFHTISNVPFDDKEGLLRFIDNHNTAYSISDTVEVQVKKDGQPIKDTVLRVDQVTANRYALILSKD